jgi:hypothetical protein
MVPSSGGGRKLMRTRRAGDAEEVCSGTGGGVADSSGVSEGVGVVDSCAAALQSVVSAAMENAIRLFVFPSEGACRAVTTRRREESLTAVDCISNNKGCLNRARHDTTRNNASLRLGKRYRAVHSRAEILRRRRLLQTDHATD